MVLDMKAFDASICRGEPVLTFGIGLTRVEVCSTVKTASVPAGAPTNLTDDGRIPEAVSSDVSGERHWEEEDDVT